MTSMLNHKFEFDCKRLSQVMNQHAFIALPVEISGYGRKMDRPTSRKIRTQTHFCSTYASTLNGRPRLFPNRELQFLKFDFDPYHKY
jgi:hypothetical protein